MYGTRCNGCGEFVEGEVVTALGKTYHPSCFACTVCKRPFPPGDRVTFNGRDCLCQMCAQPMSSSPKELSASSSNVWHYRWEERHVSIWTNDFSPMTGFFFKGLIFSFIGTGKVLDEI
ncbi:PREDICTED: actin-binding LIM protein 1-like [Chlamydotis macqueenii]|uniref:actin-binding LIM protein 1-like n=1 Tax=Chlamydotis macqueenii TaxID=187382 RepID=UPI000529C3F2|nr:PREDICTED: actin-binding LIM protein 1-like [Chlamydotis macqueenii]